MSRGETEIVTVHLLEVPISEWQRASAHMEAVKREFDIISADLDPTSVPRRLLTLVEDLDVRFGDLGAEAELRQAAERGEQSVDLVVDVPPEVADAARSLDEMMDEVDRFCQDGEQLLTLATPPELVELRRWMLGELTRQIEEGLPPVPWRGSARNGTQSRIPVPDPASPETGDRERQIRIQGDLDLLTAGSLRDEILSARSEGTALVTLDLTGVEFMDSVGLSLLVTAHQRLAREGLALRLLLPERLRLLFDIAGLTEVLQPEFVV